MKQVQKFTGNYLFGIQSVKCCCCCLVNENVEDSAPDGGGGLVYQGHLNGGWAGRSGCDGELEIVRSRLADSQWARCSGQEVAGILLRWRHLVGHVLSANGQPNVWAQGDGTLRGDEVNLSVDGAAGRNAAWRRGASGNADLNGQWAGSSTSAYEKNVS